MRKHANPEQRQQHSKNENNYGSSYLKPRREDNLNGANQKRDITLEAKRS